MKDLWKLCKLDDCIQLLSGGTPSKQNPEFWNGNIPWVSSKDMYLFRLDTTQDSITENAVEKGAKLVPPGTVLIAVRGMRLQKEIPVVEVQRESSFNQDLKACICKENILSRFLFYWLRANEYNLRGICDEAAHGTKRLQTDQLLSVDINIPPLPTQERIADILSKYDDLIDNNNRRIALLEESVHQLYREWFVRLRFPGYEKSAISDGIPEGWERTNIGSLLQFHIGGGWGKEEVIENFTEPGFVIRGTDIPNVASGQVQDVPFRFHKKSNIKSRKLQDGDIVFEVSGGSKTQGVGRLITITTSLLNQFNHPIICASFCKLLRPKSRNLSNYLFCLLDWERETGALAQYESPSGRK